MSLGARSFCNSFDEYNVEQAWQLCYSLEQSRAQGSLPYDSRLFQTLGTRTPHTQPSSVHRAGLSQHPSVQGTAQAHTNLPWLAGKSELSSQLLGLEAATSLLSRSRDLGRCSLQLEVESLGVWVQRGFRKAS